MAECIFCKNDDGYGGYPDGGCKHIDKVELDGHSICKHFEFTTKSSAEVVVMAFPERKCTYEYLKKYKIMK